MKPTFSLANALLVVLTGLSSVEALAQTTTYTEEYQYDDARRLKRVVFESPTFDLPIAISYELDEEGNAVGIEAAPFSPVQADDERAIEASFRVNELSPNPVGDAMRITFTLPLSSSVSVAIYNEIGQRVRRMAKQVQQAGTHSIHIDLKGLPSGVYFSRLSAGSFSDVKKFVHLR